MPKVTIKNGPFLRKALDKAAKSLPKRINAAMKKAIQDEADAMLLPAMPLPDSVVFTTRSPYFMRDKFAFEHNGRRVWMLVTEVSSTVHLNGPTEYTVRGERIRSKPRKRVGLKRELRTFHEETSAN